jgi:hypothetical protein
MAHQVSSKSAVEAQLAHIYRESDELFTTYMKSLSPFSPRTEVRTTASPVVKSAERTMDNRSSTPYQIRTLATHNMARVSLLPLFPMPLSTSSATPHLLLANVPSEWLSFVQMSIALQYPFLLVDSLTEPQYARIRRYAYPPLFKFELNTDDKSHAGDSFMGFCYEQLYTKTSQQLKVDIPIIDYNLTRLRQCLATVAAQRHHQSTMLTIDELPLALEFYLQIDGKLVHRSNPIVFTCSFLVDMFFLKTCAFNDVQPRMVNGRHREGLFCLATPEARFAIEPCNHRQCLCCRSPYPRRLAIPFSVPHIHRFVNQYEAILNCPAVGHRCSSPLAHRRSLLFFIPCRRVTPTAYSMCSLVPVISWITSDTQTCLLAKHSHVSNKVLSLSGFNGSSASLNRSPRRRQSDHARVSHRRNQQRIYLPRQQILGVLIYALAHLAFHSLVCLTRKKVNDQLWLYQHSARCSAAMQLFLDQNPDYWCFVPMPLAESNLTGRSIQQSSMVQAEPVWVRDNEEVRFLVANVPEPPLGFSFSHWQRQQQARFFKWAQDRIVPLDNVDLYNADIVAVCMYSPVSSNDLLSHFLFPMPEQCSTLFRLFVESLLITHAECKLNQEGHLVRECIDPNRNLPSSWCANLTRRPSAALI